MSTFHERKQHRTDYYELFTKGWKERDCSACNGSGHYDSNAHPRCAACDGTGKEKFKDGDA
jgi:DnaJ-class molecular chaperone